MTEDLLEFFPGLYRSLISSFFDRNRSPEESILNRDSSIMSSSMFFL